MKQLTLILGLLISIISYSQESVYTKKELKEIAKRERKEKQEAENKIKRDLTRNMLDAQRFVLEADYIGNGRGQRIPVQSNLNFVVIDSIEVVIQIGTMHGMGYNGLGGITVEGTVTKYDLSKKEGKRSNSYYLAIQIFSTLGTYDLSFFISETGNTDLTLRGNTMGQLNYSGELVPVGLSRIFKGSSSF